MKSLSSTRRPSHRRSSRCYRSPDLHVPPLLPYPAEAVAARSLEGNHGNHRMMEGMGKPYQWIGLRENLQETIDFAIKYEAFL